MTFLNLIPRGWGGWGLDGHDIINLLQKQPKETNRRETSPKIASGSLLGEFTSDGKGIFICQQNHYSEGNTSRLAVTLCSDTLAQRRRMLHITVSSNHCNLIYACLVWKVLIDILDILEFQKGAQIIQRMCNICQNMCNGHIRVEYVKLAIQIGVSHKVFTCNLKFGVQEDTKYQERAWMSPQVVHKISIHIQKPYEVYCKEWKWRPEHQSGQYWRKEAVGEHLNTN